MAGSKIATATARWLHGDVRTTLSTSAAPGPAQSTMIASNRHRVRCRSAISELATVFDTDVKIAERPAQYPHNLFVGTQQQ